jgi:hypothetical protein
MKGCEYRISKKALTEFLSVYGMITSDVGEVMFTDGTVNKGIDDGKNHKCIYAVVIRLP